MLELRHKSSLKHKQRTRVTPLRPTRIRSAVAGLLNLFTSFGVELKRLTGQLGYTNLQAIVGRSDLLEQVRGENLLNLRNLLQIIEHPSVTTTEGVSENNLRQFIPLTQKNW